jgi:CheY-like chemotaxis protein/HPt (histidine-containing phosphotransfer) domain-containing protein
MDGVMLAREIAKRRKGLPMVLLSSSMYRRAEEAERGLFSTQLLKPVRQQQLREALAAAIAAGRGAALRGGRKPGRRGATGAVQPLRVLVVDDIEVNRRLAAIMLRKLGYRSDTARTGREAIRAVERRRYDLVLMDVQMPGIDGLEATRRIIGKLGDKRPRIVAMTASAMVGDRERCLAAGMDDYLAKPIDPLALRAALERREHRNAAAAAPSGAPPALDRSRLDSLKPYDDDGTMVKKVIAVFLADAPAQVEAIRKAHRSGDAERLFVAAHALKGAASNVGALALHDAAARIESQARQGGLAGVARLVEALSAELDAASRALRAWA